MASYSTPHHQCPICCESYTRVTRRHVECPHCAAMCCATCVQKYLLSTAEDPRCMQCHVLWSREFLETKVVSHSFMVGSYKKHREQVLIERELSMLPDSQHLVQHFREAERLSEYVKAQEERIKSLSMELIEAKNQKTLARNTIHRIVDSSYQQGSSANAPVREQKERRVFVRACPGEECRGFLSSAWHCLTCDLWACSDCGEQKNGRDDREHVCDPNTVETNKLLKSDTKPCPKCASLIYKIEGCDQMFCTQCTTVFSWTTGRIISNTGVIHNPHYFEWMRARNGGHVPRAPGDIPCGGLPTIWEIERALNSLEPNEPLRANIFEYLRMFRHVQNVYIPRLRNRFQVQDNADIRLKYLLHVIDQDRMKSMLMTREKKNERDISIRDVYEMALTVATDILRRFLEDMGNVREILKELQLLKDYANDQLRILQKRYDCRVLLLRTFI